MKKVFGYIRVSTPKQGQQGVSLSAQRDAISRYAQRLGFEIIAWFEEQETAAKRGRSEFNRMLKLLQRGKAGGLVLHKIDRGARNLKDWSDLAELIDAGVEVHFANESLDMRSRGGRLSADIQAVVAADYIRNLREETKKGFDGRLKQGIYPLGAPIGYLDKGGGKPKEPDPVKAPLVRKAFELYATGRFTLHTLQSEIHRLGLRNKRGTMISIGGLSLMLNNPFYIGLIRLRKTGQTFAGIHKPIIPKSLFDRVARILSGKLNTRVQKHDFLFRRLVRCGQCGYTLIGERQKGHHYYRCHTGDCPTTGIREESIEWEIEKQFAALVFNDAERDYFQSRLAVLKQNWGTRQEEENKSLSLRTAQIQDRLNRLTDAFLDGTIERDLFENRKAALLLEKKAVEETTANLRDASRSAPDHLSEFLELSGDAWLSYRLALPEEKRDLIRIATSNRSLVEKNVVVELSFPFSEVAKRHSFFSSPLDRDIPRIWDRLLDILAAACLRGELPRLKSKIDCGDNVLSQHSYN